MTPSINPYENLAERIVRKRAEKAGREARNRRGRQLVRRLARVRWAAEDIAAAEDMEEERVLEAEERAAALEARIRAEAQKIGYVL